MKNEIKVGDYVIPVEKNTGLEFDMMKVYSIDDTLNRCYCYCVKKTGRRGYITIYDLKLEWLQVDLSITGDPIGRPFTFGKAAETPWGELTSNFLSRIYYQLHQ